MNIQLNEIQSEENLLGLGFSFNQKEYSFASIRRADEYITTAPDFVFSLSFGIDLSAVSYTRSVFSFWDYLGDVGVLYDMLILIGS